MTERERKKQLSEEGAKKPLRTIEKQTSSRIAEQGLHKGMFSLPSG
jgi:hypothetical protein